MPRRREHRCTGDGCVRTAVRSARMNGAARVMPDRWWRGWVDWEQDDPRWWLLVVVSGGFVFGVILLTWVVGR